VALAIRRVELKSAVRTLIVVTVDALVEHLLEVTPAANDQPFQALENAHRLWKARLQELPEEVGPVESHLRTLVPIVRWAPPSG
jgi:hypothetical protein